MTDSLLHPNNHETVTAFLARRARLGFSRTPKPHVRLDLIRAPMVQPLPPVVAKAPPAPVRPPPPLPTPADSAWPPYTPPLFYDAVETATGTLPRRTLKQIITEVCWERRISVRDVLSQRRNASIVEARHEIFYRGRTETDLSTTQIGRRIGGRDHTTVLHGVRAYAKRNGLPVPV